jgi:hypothetical protein
MDEDSYHRSKAWHIIQTIMDVSLDCLAHIYCYQRGDLAAESSTCNMTWALKRKPKASEPRAKLQIGHTPEGLVFAANMAHTVCSRMYRRLKWAKVKVKHPAGHCIALTATWLLTTYK